MRLNDGIHMTMAGYIRIAEPVADRIRRDAGLERAAEPSDG
jgi:lysophospholipase L1-like esterase